MKKDFSPFALWGPTLVLLVTIISFGFVGGPPRPDNSPKIDNEAVNGLSGTRGSLAYLVAEIEIHLHGSEYWYGKSAGDTYLDNTVLTEWQVQAGSSEGYGTAIQISNGDEIGGGSTSTFVDLHEILVTAASSANKVYKIQFLYGTGVVGDATVLTEEAGYFPAAGRSGSIDLGAFSITANNKIWVRLACETNSATLDFLLGIRNYEG